MIMLQIKYSMLNNINLHWIVIQWGTVIIKMIFYMYIYMDMYHIHVK